MHSCWCAGNCPHSRVATRLLSHDKRGAAELAIKRALLEAPNCAEANRLMGMMLTQNNHASFGTAHFARARASSDSELVFLQQGWNWRGQNELEHAIATFREGLALHPSSVRIYDGLITALVTTGALEEAQEAVDRSAGLPGAKILRRVQAMLANAQGDNRKALELLPAGDLDHLELADRGRYLDALGRHAEAWACWMSAKEYLTSAAGHVYDADAMEGYVASLKQIALRVRELSHFDLLGLVDLPKPIFIGGFPRSGTTMIETVLSAHPQIAAGDELPFLNEVIDRLPAWLNVPVAYPKAINAFAFGDSAGAIEFARAHYLRRSLLKIGRVDHGALFFTDKMPLHEMHLPLIALILPDARFYYVRRHPFDIIISAMSYFLVHGHYYASSLESAAYHYVLLDGLMQYYKKHLSFRAQEIRYESFVADQVKETKRFFPAPLKPVDACFQFHENPRYARTISHAQVKRPLYTSSVERFRPYLPFFPREVIESLRPICDREGYAIA